MKDIIKHSLKDLMFEIENNSYKIIEKEIEEITKKMEDFKEPNIEPMIYPINLETFELREDEVEEEYNLEEILKNSTSYLNQVKVPKVIE